MRNRVECYPCLLKQAVEAGKMATDDEAVHWEILQEALEKIGAVGEEWLPIVMGKEMQAIVRRLADHRDPYGDIKEEYNEKAKRLLSVLEAEIDRSENAFLAALKVIAIANIIDFGAFHPDQLDLAGFFRAKSSSDFKGDIEPTVLMDAIAKADSILYVADNCGEIIFDCYFINRFLADKRVYLSVRGGPVLNDATREDLDGILLHGCVEVMDSGDDSPGVVLSTSSDAFKEKYHSVDLVLLKGQGNFEGIGAPERENVYSLFVVKCPVIARHVGCDIDELVLMVPR
uniref:Damage-control phosphatase ARMT1-like metal-binding domain-containing protein n=1 Tax=Candidatus Kentrum sp. LFY TaxID=2126342 RepID=A0A450V8W7_9GAMM|nr:MAG: hypothetical protein BECKLFY1418A_GA0070994_11402 [Candidatus Kentron sp. LFY]